MAEKPSNTCVAKPRWKPLINLFGPSGLLGRVAEDRDESVRLHLLPFPEANGPASYQQRMRTVEQLEAFARVPYYICTFHVVRGLLHAPNQSSLAERCLELLVKRKAKVGLRPKDSLRQADFGKHCQPRAFPIHPHPHERWSNFIQRLEGAIADIEPCLEQVERSGCDSRIEWPMSIQELVASLLEYRLQVGLSDLPIEYPSSWLELRDLICQDHGIGRILSYHARRLCGWNERKASQLSEVTAHEVILSSIANSDIWNNRAETSRIPIYDINGIIIKKIPSIMIRRNAEMSEHSPDAYYSYFAGVLTEPISSRESSSVNETVRKETEQLIHVAMSRLPNEELTIVYRSFWLGMTLKEIAKQDGLDLDEIITILHQGLEQFEKELFYLGVTELGLD